MDDDPTLIYVTVLMMMLRTSHTDKGHDDPMTQWKRTPRKQCLRKHDIVKHISHGVMIYSL